ncbi:hypothetical protein D3C73_1280020 [compost metagenome]
MQQANAVDQVGFGKLPDAGARVVVPGVDQHVVTPLAHPQQGPRPRCLFDPTGVAGPGQRRGDDAGRQATARHAGIGERRPIVGHQA